MDGINGSGRGAKAGLAGEIGREAREEAGEEMHWCLNVGNLPILETKVPL
jgi:hypothetical protein